jgi:hypothetical protein
VDRNEPKVRSLDNFKQLPSAENLTLVTCTFNDQNLTTERLTHPTPYAFHFFGYVQAYNIPYFRTIVSAAFMEDGS